MSCMSIIKLYPSTKITNVEWLGDIPKHWDVQRLHTITKLLVSNVDKHQILNEEFVHLCNYVDVYKNDYINENLQFMSATATKSEIDKFHLLKGDIAITKDSESWNDIGIPALITKTIPGLICGYHLAILRPKIQNIISGFLLRALQSKAVANQFNIKSKGVTRYGLSHADIKSIQVPLPSMQEQKAIVRYLDYMDKRIQKFVQAKKKLVELFKEQKQAIIHSAVTRGLDLTTQFKDSGIEWLGEIPAHWTIQKLKLHVKNIVEFQTVNNMQTACIALEHVESWTGRICMPKTSIDFDSKLNRFNSNDVLFGKLRPYLAKVTRPKQGGFCVSEFLVLRSKHCGMSSGYIEQFLKSRPIVDVINSSTFGAKMPRTDWNFVGNLLVPIPPLHEQTAIVNFLNEATERIDSKIDLCSRQIDLMQEYRARLISDVVTGKLDVREAVLNLPPDSDDSDTLNQEQ